MTKPKQIRNIIKSPSPHWVGNGFLVSGFFQNFEEKNSPFLLLDYASRRYFEPSSIPRGVGSHPHKGFETVTIAFSGSVDHKDNQGNSGTIEEGGVQWMTAGSGIMHSEFFGEQFNSAGGDFEMVQLWVNLPSKHKLTKPGYQSLDKSSIPKVTIGESTLSVIAGSYLNQKGIARTFSQIEMYTVELRSEIALQFPAEYNTLILVLDGEIIIEDQIISSKNLIEFANSGQTITIKPSPKVKRSTLLVLSGKPLDEPIAHYGPFVMNTEEELIEAVNDFNNGKFAPI